MHNITPLLTRAILRIALYFEQKYVENMTEFMWIIIALMGLAAGFIGGLLGISGGLITVPCLFLVFSLQHFPTGDLMQLAIGTSLAAMVFNAISATYTHHRQKTVKWKLVKSMLPGLILGCIAGAFLSYLLSTTILQLIFGIFAVVLGLYLYRHHRLPPITSHHETLNPIGFGVGAISNILGIGGGTMFVPIFIGLKIPMKNAIGTSAATGVIVSLAGAISYLVFGWGETHYEHTWGYIYIPAFVILAITTFITAPFGAKMAERINSVKLKRLFSIALLALGVLMLVR